MNRRFRQYNLVEVILALGVVAIGVVSIMALFPIGASATRDAAMETYSSNVADEVFHVVQYLALKDWNTWAKGTAKIPNSKPNYTDSDTDSNKWRRLDNATQGIDSNIFRHESKEGVFLLISHHDSSAKKDATLAAPGASETNDTITYEKVDFRAVVLAWKEQVRVDPTGTDPDLGYDEAAKLVIEVSRPEEMPYPRRQKRYFSYEIAKPGAFVVK